MASMPDTVLSGGFQWRKSIRFVECWRLKMRGYILMSLLVLPSQGAEPTLEWKLFWECLCRRIFFDFFLMIFQLVEPNRQVTDRHTYVFNLVNGNGPFWCFLERLDAQHITADRVANRASWCMS